MKQTVNEWDFRDAFLRSDTYKNHFTYDGLNALFEYLENFENDMGKELELDIVAICCDFTEYDNLDEYHRDYEGSGSNNLDELGEEKIIIRIGDTERFILDVNS